MRQLELRPEQRPDLGLGQVRIAGWVEGKTKAVIAFKDTHDGTDDSIEYADEGDAVTGWVLIDLAPNLVLVSARLVIDDGLTDLRSALAAAIEEAKFLKPHSSAHESGRAAGMAVLVCKLFGLDVSWDDGLIGYEDESLGRPENRQYVDDLHYVYRAITGQTGIDDALAKIRARQENPHA